MKRFLVLLFCFVVCSSHELFLKTDTYFLKEKERSELYLFNGTFDESENIITRDRIIEASVVGPAYEFLPEERHFYDKDSATYLRFKTGKSGTYLAGISTRPRVITLEAAEFEDYLNHEGLTDVIADRKEKGIDGQPVKEKYSKHVKALLQVGDQTTDHYATDLDYPIEFIPLKNPYNLQIGEKISFRLLFKGSPVANQTVHFSYRKNATGEEIEERQTRTDERGECSFEITEAGKWYVATIHMRESEEENIDYESNWATLTFGVANE